LAVFVVSSAGNARKAKTFSPAHGFLFVGIFRLRLFFAFINVGRLLLLDCVFPTFSGFSCSA